MTKYFSFSLVAVFIFLINCTSNEDAVTSLGSVPEVTPGLITSFDQVDSLFFSYIGFKSIPLASGDFIFPIYSPARLTKLSKDGARLLAITRNGRGPNELLSI